MSRDDFDSFLTAFLAASIDNGRDALGWVNIDYLVFEHECGMNGTDVYRMLFQRWNN